MHYTNAFSRGRIGCRFPLPADIREESRSRRTIFPKYFAATITVVADSRSTDHDLRRFLHFRDRFCNQLGALDPAVANPGFLSSGSAAGSTVLPRPMNGGT